MQRNAGTVPPVRAGRMAMISAMVIARTVSTATRIGGGLDPSRVVYRLILAVEAVIDRIRMSRRRQ